MARKSNKDDVSVTFAVAGTDDDDVLNGRNDADDVLDGGAGNDYLDSFGGADTLIGGSGADTFKVHSWASSNLSAGVDTIMDFEASDKIDLTNLRHYSEADVLVATSRPVEWGDITLIPIAGGNHMHVEVVAGDSRWDVDMDILGETPTVDSFIF